MHPRTLSWVPAMGWAQGYREMRFSSHPPGAQSGEGAPVKRCYSAWKLDGGHKGGGMDPTWEGQ